MKLSNLFIAVGLFSIFFTASCKKNRDSLSKLPPETQTGANTFGCLVNGQVFVPRGNSGYSAILTCYYQNVYSTSSGFVFQVAARDKSQGDKRFSVVILLDSIVIQEGMRMNLKKGKVLGEGAYYTSDDNLVENNFFTSDDSGGEIFVKKFDPINQIISATFWFNALNKAGNVVRVTDGRFDMQFTR